MPNESSTSTANSKTQSRPASLESSVVKESYSSPEYLQREYKKLWPKVWQAVCRVEELSDAGDYVTYEIGNESIIALRSESGEIRVFHNSCLHRGRRLLSGSGKANNLRCPFHGWRWDLDGNNTHVTYKDDWCGTLDDDDLSLGTVRHDSWGGFLFVTFDPDAEPLLEYLGEAAEALAPFRLDQMRYRWRKWLKIPANWKVALEAFNEGYHVSITHWPLNQFSTTSFVSRAAGRHGTFATDHSNLRPESGESDGKGSTEDIKAFCHRIAGYYRFLKANIDSNMSDTMVYAAQSLASTVSEDATPMEAMGQLMLAAQAIDEARGVPWPDITPEQYQKGGIDWHIFPNLVLLPMATNCLCYRARPDENDPDSCIFEVSQIERLPEADIKKVENLRNDDLQDYDFWGEILLQDFQQMEDTQRGMKSSGYPGPRLNPKQEASLENFHRVYHEYLNE